MTIAEHPLMQIPEVVAALGDGIDESKLTVAAILLDAANDSYEQDSTPLEMLDEYTKGFMTFDTDDAYTIADRLREYFNRTEGYGSFDFEFVLDRDFGTSSYNVMTANPAGGWFSISGDVKYLDPERSELSGLPAAIHIAQTLIADHQQLSGYAKASADTLAIHKISLGLGTAPEWKGADTLEWIADVIGLVREHPGDKDPTEYLERFKAEYNIDAAKHPQLSLYIDDYIVEQDEDTTEKGL